MGVETDFLQREKVLLGHLNQREFLKGIHSSLIGSYSGLPLIEKKSLEVENVCIMELDRIRSSKPGFSPESMVAGFGLEITPIAADKDDFTSSVVELLEKLNNLYNLMILGGDTIATYEKILFDVEEIMKRRYFVSLRSRDSFFSMVAELKSMPPTTILDPEGKQLITYDGVIQSVKNDIKKLKK
eukprot:gnl/Carplike_NY0171/858_a1180_1650.p1 GENE.gnl/Carplike_NY0171/858_a1180_1650~~gnl/Carplike_NY0171/858_a1180_1650.p1  ORF type:complete len:201 (+),score=45.70 gnl/Carplike_NY0171/858_a1180_1650:51-605(+)